MWVGPARVGEGKGQDGNQQPNSVQQDDAGGREEVSGFLAKGEKGLPLCGMQPPSLTPWDPGVSWACTIGS